MFLFWLNFVSNGGIRNEMRIKRFQTLEDAAKLEPPYFIVKAVFLHSLTIRKIEFPVRATRNPQ
jgi:hypothetical protein